MNLFVAIIKTQSQEPAQLDAPASTENVNVYVFAKSNEYQTKLRLSEKFESPILTKN